MDYVTAWWAGFEGGLGRFSFTFNQIGLKTTNGMNGNEHTNNIWDPWKCRVLCCAVLVLCCVSLPPCAANRLGNVSVTYKRSKKQQLVLCKVR